MINDTDDFLLRQQALNPAESFIIQAPAGSGKTELLTQRFLRLLSCVESPEEIIAVTFTRKAAAEMRHRILLALSKAECPEPIESHKKLTWKLAKQALNSDRKYQWKLFENPNRLRILTIDALSSYLCKKMPFQAEVGIQSSITSNPLLYYQEAAKKLLTHVNENSKFSTYVEKLLLYLNNDALRFINLLTQILSKREQWLPYVIGQNKNLSLRSELELGLKHIILDAIYSVKSLLNKELFDELFSLIKFASRNLKENDLCGPITVFSDDVQFDFESEVKITDLAYWLGFSKLLLTESGAWRKKVDKRQGFPALKTLVDYKNRMQYFLNLMEKNQELLKALNELNLCPAAAYSNEQWEIIESLIQLLPLLAAELKLIFQEKGEVDFIEVSLSALNVLGNFFDPTELMLNLDYHIKHILLDEFQDTSVLQIRLLEHLISGWIPNDGHTLFLVGDPMQSIYRFRNAEVGLFLKTQQEGIGNIHLTSLRLKNNYRSSPELVSWINKFFSNIFPNQSDLATGMIPYSPCISLKLPVNDSGVFFYSHASSNLDSEPSTLLKIIQHYQNNNPEESIAILVRSRNHLIDIVQLLNRSKIAFHAVDIDPLAKRLEIIDLLSLTKALLHLGDSIAWFAILRAPFVGLTLHDLHAIAQYGKDKPVWFSLSDFKKIPNLSIDGSNRLQRIVPILSPAFSQFGHLTLSSWIEGVWLALGGPASLYSEDELNNTQSFFKLLEDIEDNFSLDILETALIKLYVNAPSQVNCQLQIMTIHKAKGLEFDHVILPQLDAVPPRDSASLLMWLERPVTHYSDSKRMTDLILSPIKPSHNNEDPLSKYLMSVNKSKSVNELIRLLYVAITRAKKSLHLSTYLETEIENETTFKIPQKGSFSELLWNVFKDEMNNAFQNNKINSNDAYLNIDTDSPNFLRLLSNWKHPIIDLPNTMVSDQKIFSETQNPMTLLDFSESNFHQIVGTLIHEILLKIAKDTLEIWDVCIPSNQKKKWKNRLMQLGLSPLLCEEGLKLIEQAILNTLSDERGRWILASQYEFSRSEYAVTMLNDNQAKQYRIDRVFIDKGVRWIIDYKTGTPENNLNEFIQHQKIVHTEQLNHYARILNQIEQMPTCLGLYFPSCKGWCQWDY